MFNTFILLCIATLVAGDFTPTAPGPGDSYAAGSQCQIKWEVGDWKNVTIALMSGSNSQMERVTTVATGLDGSDPSLSPYKWTCPEVSPYSTIYFYQFTNGEDVQSSKWTTRFTITSPSGAHSPPEHDIQSNGDAVPWGSGTLSSSNSSSGTNSTSDGSSTKGYSDQDTSTSEGSNKTQKMTKTSSPEREATPTLSLPPSPNASVQTTGSPVGYSASSYSGARSDRKGRYWSSFLCVTLVVCFVPWLG